MKMDLKGKTQACFFISVIIALGIIAYANSLHNQFISDDIPAIVKNPFISQPFKHWLAPAPLLNSINYLIGKGNPFIVEWSSGALRIILLTHVPTTPSSNRA
jgi:hypothetical protein